MRIEVYSDCRRSIWNAFVRASKNGTFLFEREYMEYHRDRFEDHSLLIWNAGDDLVALLPASRSGVSLVSHEGLTYGGFVTDGSMKTPQMIEVFEATVAYLRAEGFGRFVYKSIPYIYHRIPAEEDRYGLFLQRARITRRGLLSVVPGGQRLPFQERRVRGAKRARQHGLRVTASEDLETFWGILADRLMTAHGVRPVHTLAEIRLLQARFPRCIRFFACHREATMLAGAVIYESERVAHVQYVAASDPGLELGALDLLFSDLLVSRYVEGKYFDFGTSDENEGLFLNRGLIDQKEGFGARAVVHDHYEIELVGWKPRRPGT